MATTAVSLRSYKSNFSGIPGYIAGLPSYPRNFSRDTFLAGILAMDKDLLRTQIILAANHQGTGYDAATGEEAGKVHHEYPGVKLAGRGDYVTTYNACDTTALFLLAIEALGQLDECSYAEIIAGYQRNIVLAVSYILRHVKTNIFYEYPPDDADHFALKVTYWKDSIAPDPLASELCYPVAYALAHFQAARGLLSAARILRTPGLLEAADVMFKTGIRKFLRPAQFVVATGHRFQLAQPSSDELHSLAYIPQKYGHLLPLEAIEQRSKGLFTSVGLACTPESIATLLDDPYHGYVVWPFEQAFIHYGSAKFNLPSCADLAKRIVPFIAQGNELIGVKPKIEPRGNSHQLWSVAAGIYFDGYSSLRDNPWL
ncbi:hypothetical protein HJC99_00510 [Candidatus Saccharibacteria bacterium]|nr:hypothetical protein [Candidatus Saccharibacteria bacterium]